MSTLSRRVDALTDVTQDAGRYVECTDVVEAIRVGLEEIRCGLGRPAADVLEELRREFAIRRAE